MANDVFKCRAWINNSHESYMIYSDKYWSIGYIEFGCDYIDSDCTEIIIGECDGDQRHLSTGKRNPFMLALGFQDKNGKDVYVGDIIRAIDNLGQNVVLQIKNINDWVDIARLIDRSSVEVIGNIYENKK